MKAGYLKEVVVDSRNWDADHGAQQKGNPLPPPLGVIDKQPAENQSKFLHPEHSYCIRPDRISFTVIVEEVGLHRSNSQMGDPARFL